MFALVETAARIEAAEASLSAGAATAALASGRVPDAFVAAVGGGVAVYAGLQCPVNKVIGTGFGGAPDAGRLADVERLFAARGSAVQAEVATLANPAWHAALARRGYVLAGFENVLGLRIGASAGVPHASAGWDASVDVGVCQPGDERLWLQVVAEGFASPDDVVAQAAGQNYPREAIERVLADMMAAGGFVRYIARVGGQVAGGAGLRLHEGVAQLCGAATLPAFRRRGVQTALYGARLRDAAAAGCDLAVVTAAPGSKSMENALRRGFALLYARALHVLEPA